MRRCVKYGRSVGYGKVCLVWEGVYGKGRCVGYGKVCRV